MFFSQELMERINAVKKRNGFSMGDVHYELSRAVEEIGELVEAIDMNKPIEDVGEEFADAIIFIFAAADLLKINLEDVTLKKVARNETRVWVKRNSE